MILLIDNYDSFTFNLVQLMAGQGAELDVRRNDQITLDQVEAMKPEAIVISPGPCTPNEAGISVESIRRFSGRIPILGVCLGHQSIGAAFGGTVSNASRIMHGKTSQVTHDGTGLYAGVTSPFQAGRYHSLVVLRKGLPDCLVVTATSDDGEIMGLKHVTHPTVGVQFHPESVLTPEGNTILGNFLALTTAWKAGQRAS
jgi:anthranilate synthase/aminodeoxychorismate synthase-like glutamine amidotransferase